MNKRRKHKKEGRSQGLRVTALSSSESTHDFHKYWMQQNGLTPVLHFHLAASINPASGSAKVKVIFLKLICFITKRNRQGILIPLLQ